jgi:cell cycle sensor histidine kinase DivJ
LIDNAVGATWPGGAIAICSHLDNDMVVFSVVDDGLGVDGLDTEHLFDAFERGPRRSWQTAGGTGLGLAIVRAIAAAHGGEATMHSSPGLGTTVRITVPWNAGAAQQRLASAQRPIVAL